MLVLCRAQREPTRDWCVLQIGAGRRFPVLKGEPPVLAPRRLFPIPAATATLAALACGDARGRLRQHQRLQPIRPLISRLPRRAPRRPLQGDWLSNPRQASLVLTSPEGQRAAPVEGSDAGPLAWAKG